jgi:hypothetical protein
VSKPSAQRALLPWIVKFAIVAFFAVVATALIVGPARSGQHRVSAQAVANQGAATLSPSAVTPATRGRIQANYAALPLAFEANKGLTDPQVKYLARGNGYTLFLTPSGAVFAFRSKSALDNDRTSNGHALGVQKTTPPRSRSAEKNSTAVVRMKILGGNAQAKVAASGQLSGKINYYIGNDPQKWHTGVAQYERVSYENVYPGVNLAFHGLQRQLEFDFIVTPRANPALINLGFTGARTLATDVFGNLLLSTSAGRVAMHKPVAYQEQNGTRQLVDARFVLQAGKQVSFELGPYDRSRELVIDPAITYATYLGGSGEDEAFAVAVDGSGNAYITGQTASINFPAHSGTVSSVGGFDAFVSKLNASGSSPLIYTTLIGGSSDDSGLGIAVNSTGTYVVGNTKSSTFPATVNLGPRGGQDLFVAKLDNTAGLAQYVTRIGGTGTESGNGIAVDASGNAYIGGETFSTDFPTASAIQTGNAGTDDGFVAKLNAAGTALLFSTYLGGTSGDLVTGIALDASNNAYVTGITVSSDFPTTTGAFQTSPAGGDDGFVAAIRADGSAKIYSTYLGGSLSDDALGIAVDAVGEAYVTGNTLSSDFPKTINAAQATLKGAMDVFVTKLKVDGSGLLFSTYYGGTLDDSGTGIALDAFNDAYVTGRTFSSDYPVSGSPFQNSLSGTTDAFVTELSNTGFVVYSSYLGGTGNENSLGGLTTQPAIGGVAVDATSNAYLAGDTASTTGFPVSSSPLQSAYGGGLADAFVAKVAAAPADFSVAISPTSISTPSGQTTAAITVTVSSVNAAFGKPVALSCSGKPSQAACNFSTTSVTPGSSPGTATLTISTNGSAGNGMLTPPATRRRTLFYALFLPLLLPLTGLTLCQDSRKKRRVVGFLLIGLIMAALFLLPACGGSSSGGGGGCKAVPSAPTGLAASSTTSTGTTLNWSAASAPSGCSVTSYTVYKNGASIGTATSTNFAVTGLSPSTTYSFTVAASDSAGISAQSSAVSVTTSASGSQNTPPGTYIITLSGAAGGVIHSAQLSLKVN